MNLDIGAIITQHLTAQPPRKDHGGISVSDVANGCARAVWWRIHHGLRTEFDGQTRKKFEYGYALEGVVANALLAADFTLWPPKVVVRDSAGDDWTGYNADDYDEAPKALARPTDIVGHPDIVVYDKRNQTILIEVKSTMLFRQGYGPPKHPNIEDLRTKSGNYFIQAAAYAKAVGAKQFVIYVSDRGTGIDASYTCETDREYPAFEERLQLLLPALNPDVEPDPTLPSWTRGAKGTSYLCRGCPVISCFNNPSHR